MSIPATAEHPDLIQALGLADPATLADFDMLARVACILTGAPHAFVSFADAKDIWPATAGAARGTRRPLERAYCSTLLAGDADNFVSRNVLLDRRTRAVTRQSGDPHVVAYVGALLRANDGRRLGTLCVTDSVERDFDSIHIELLNGLARQVMNLVSLRATKRELTYALVTMTELAQTDALTGLLNRRTWHEEAEALRRHVLRQGGSLAVVILDLDHFKRINDGHGHAAGDAVLAEVGRLLTSELRATDRIGRIGGEEFAIAMPFTTLEAAASRIEQLRRSIGQRPIANGDAPISVTVSGGIAALQELDASIDGAMRRADEALYRAKAAGRDRIQVDEPHRMRSAGPSRARRSGASDRSHLLPDAARQARPG